MEELPRIIMQVPFSIFSRRKQAPLNFWKIKGEEGESFSPMCIHSKTFFSLPILMRLGAFLELWEGGLFDEARDKWELT